MKNWYFYLFIIVLNVCYLPVCAQKAPVDTDQLLLRPAGKFSFNPGLQYMSDLTYAGRRDQSSVPVLMPSFTGVYQHSLFLGVAGYADINGANSRAEGLSITPGYVFSLDKGKNWNGSIALSKYFITNSSPIILSSFNAALDAQLSYTTFVKVSGGATVSLDKENNRDLINSVQLDKEIWLFRTGILQISGLKITPAVTAYGGSQAFTETYYVNSQVPREIAGQAVLSPLSSLFPGLTQQEVLDKTVSQQKQQEVKQYKLLAVSASMPVVYSWNSWQFSFTPYLTKPFNQIDYNGGNASGNYFFFTTGLSYQF